jgi:orotate phosphoribosyltransferase
MQEYQRELIRLAIASEALLFGEFTLKSGRVSPYFFNAGRFNTGAALAALGRCYADAITASGIGFDMLFGPAYKGIPLATAAAVALADRHGRSVPIAYDRKEAKNHGEGGLTVGAPLAGRVLIVDDVISAGTAIRGSVEVIRAAGASLAGAVVALDRQERGQSQESAVQEVQRAFSIPVIFLVTLADLIEHLQAAGRTAELQQMRNYRAAWGVEGKP